MSKNISSPRSSGRLTNSRNNILSKLDSLSAELERLYERFEQDEGHPNYELQLKALHEAQDGVNEIREDAMNAKTKGKLMEIEMTVSFLSDLIKKLAQAAIKQVSPEVIDSISEKIEDVVSSSSGSSSGSGSSFVNKMKSLRLSPSSSPRVNLSNEIIDDDDIAFSPSHKSFHPSQRISPQISMRSQPPLKKRRTSIGDKFKRGIKRLGSALDPRGTKRRRSSSASSTRSMRSRASSGLSNSLRGARRRVGSGLTGVGRRLSSARRRVGSGLGGIRNKFRRRRSSVAPALSNRSRRSSSGSMGGGDSPNYFCTF